MFLWWGLNTRLLTSPSLGCVDVADSYGKGQDRCVNGASHNYAGLYRATDQSEALHRTCLDMLPVVFASDREGESLRKAVHCAVANFWGADFCFTTATGYGSNYVALPPLLLDVDVVIVDKDCHNSVFTGVFLGQTASLKVHKFAHNDMLQLEDILSRSLRGGATRVMVVIEGLYSMEGDVPPLDIMYRLKQDYGFVLYCDEAHSFLSLGKTGRGCLEHWNDSHPLAAPLPDDLIDLRSGTLSKAVGGIGGFIAGKARFEPCIRRRVQQLGQEQDGNGGSLSQIASLPSANMVQTLWVLKQPLRTQRNLARLHEMAHFCRRELRRLGVFVYGSEGTPVLPVWTGRPCMSARFSYALRQRGVLASPVTTPAVPFWQSRVRVNLSADFTNDQVNQLVGAIVSAAMSTGVIWKNKLRKGAMPPRLFASRCALESESKTAESEQAFESIQGIIRESSASVSAQNSSSPPASVIAAGHGSREMYGVGSGSSRWISGTFPSHLDVEALLARATGTEVAMTYADTSIGLASTVAALARPLKNRKRHIMLVPRKCSKFARDGLAMLPPASKSKLAPEIWNYNHVAHLLQQIRCHGGNDKHVCFTVYLELDHQQQQLPLDIASLWEDLAHAAGRIPITVLVNSSSLPPQNLLLPGKYDAVLPPRQVSTAKKNMHLLVFGSCSAAFGLPVGYLAGPESLIRELRYTSRAYMYTTSTPPAVMGMLCAALEAHERRGHSK